MRLLLRAYCWVLRLLGAERRAWNRQFEAGAWCRRPRSPFTLGRVAELCRGGCLIEFGCGEGNLPHALPPGTFSSYRGYDIADVAIGRAIERAKAAGMTHCAFEQADMAAWQGQYAASLILVEECLYYLKPDEMERFLRRCCANLAPGGVILIVVHSAVKHAMTLDVCRAVCAELDYRMDGERAFLTLGPKQTAGNPA